MTIRATLVALLVLLASACGGSEAYSVDETQQAFEANGYVLVDPAANPAGSALNVWDSDEVTVLVPESGAAFFVFVGDPGAAGDLWSKYDPDGSPAFDEQQSNVRVMADSELDAGDAEAVRSALEQLAN
jgi:hypothetical protein